MLVIVTGEGGALGTHVEFGRRDGDITEGPGGVYNPGFMIEVWGKSVRGEWGC